jgi:DNA-directed RNA polymerase specialized sigma24 family protein
MTQGRVDGIAVSQELARLPAEEAILFMLVVLGDESMAEIGELYGDNERKARYRYNLIVSKLRGRLLVD